MPRKGRHIRLIERALFASRWLQLPLLVGLLVALTILGLQFAIAIFEAVLDFRTLTRLDTILLTLDLIDMVLIANLIVMVALSGYQLFITGVGYPSDPEHKTFRFDEAAGPLKFRIATTIVLISTIHMLHAYLDETPLEPAMIVQLAVFQTLFILTAVVLAVIHRILPRRRLSDQPEDDEDDEDDEEPGD